MTEMKIIKSMSLLWYYVGYRRRVYFTFLLVIKSLQERTPAWVDHVVSGDYKNWVQKQYS